MQTHCRTIPGLALLIVSTVCTQGAGYTNWDNLINGWTQTSAPTDLDWRSVAASADGTKLVAVANGDAIYASTNAGADWKQTGAPGNYWRVVTCSTDGTRLAAVSDNSGTGWVYTSTNSGDSWAQVSSVGQSSSLASSANGAKLVAVDINGGVYLSANSGADWTPGNAPWMSWRGVASSADGIRLVAIGRLIYTSTNSGIDWTQTSAPDNTWNSVASSADGTRLVAGAFNNGLYTSTNAGVSWTQTSTPDPGWYSVASSADGTRFAAAMIGGGIYISTNGGASWIKTGAPDASWRSIASAADGNSLVAMVGYGGIWTAQATPLPGGATPYTSDANTILLDHFDGSTVATKVGGPVSYTNGPSGLAQGADFSRGGWVRYDLAPWPCSEGTVEAWIYPTNIPTGSILTMQWFNSDTPPGSGYVFSANVNAQGKITAGSWPGGNVTGNSIIPPNTWTHVAITWSPAGSAIYLNGVLDATTTSAIYPSLGNPAYIYAGSWGSANPLAMDELRISSIRRTNFNVLPPQPPTLTNTITSTTVSSGGSITLNAGVTGTPPFTYQWFCNGTPITGATNATLTINNFGPANVGNYRATVGNASGSVTTPTVTLATMELKMFAGITINGPVGSAYAVQATSNLSGGWATLSTITLAAPTCVYIDYASPTNRQQFYRAVPLQ